MSRKVSHRAEWTLSQTLSWVVPAGIAILLGVMYLTGNFSMVGAIVLGVMLVAMSLFFLITNRRLKKNSGLTAVLSDDESHTVEIFQFKPRAYWNGKLDSGKNKAPISKLKSASFNHTEGIQYVLFNWEEDNGQARAFVVPLRILVQDEVRRYFAAGLKGSSLKFRKEEDQKRFAHLLAEGTDLVVTEG